MMQTDSSSFYIEKLFNGEKPDENQIHEVIRFIRQRNDCADFKVISILRCLYDYSHLISDQTVKEMKACIIDFKYWMDEPGTDSMCYWSENHQIIFAVCEYLAGQKYSKEIFTNSNLLGNEHKEKAKIRINNWLLRRFQFGFIEWHSNTYYEEDIAPLSLLIDLCEDEDIVLRAKMLMDLLLLDMALHSFDGSFCASSGRCYWNQKQNPSKQDVLGILEKAFKFGRIQKFDYTRISADFIINRNYDMPEILYEIAHCKLPQLIIASNGLDLCQVREKFKNSSEIEDFGAFIWAMEAFANKETVNTTMKLYNHYKLKTNKFINDLEMINISVLQKLNLLPLLVRVLNPVIQGVAIERANTYTYKTQYGMLSTAQGYHPQKFGDQQHIWQATLPNDITVFTTHPAAAFFDDAARNISPGYWVGNGINPYSAQKGNISLSLYNLHVRKGFLERKRLQFTHAWMPFSRFDEVLFTSGDKILCARKGESYLALLSAFPMDKGEENELVQKGKVTGWACIIGNDKYDGSFAEFCNMAKSCKLILKKKTLILWVSASNLASKKSGLDYLPKGNDKLEIKLKHGFFVNDVKQNTDYPRLNALCGKVQREPDTISISQGGKNLIIDYQRKVRKMETHNG